MITLSPETRDYIAELRSALDVAEYEESSSSLLDMKTDSYGVIQAVLAVDEDRNLFEKRSPEQRMTDPSRAVTEMRASHINGEANHNETIKALTAANTLLANRIVDDIVESDGVGALKPLIEEHLTREENNTANTAQALLYVAMTAKQIDIESREL